MSISEGYVGWNGKAHRFLFSMEDPSSGESSNVETR